MKIYKSIDKYNESKSSVVTIGTFDGIHKGHQKIFNKVINASKQSNLSSVVLTFFPHPRIILNKYNEINYSSVEVDSAIQKIFSFPFYLMLMTILSSTIMMNIKQNRTKIFHLIFGILISVIIYYLSFFFEELGKNEQVPLLISIWIPLLMIGIVSMINLVRINEK